MDEAKRREIHQWLIKSQRDIGSARRLMEGQEPYLDTAVYHCQQAAEKAFKAFLTARDTTFEKTHNLVALLALCTPFEPSFSLPMWRAICVPSTHNFRVISLGQAVEIFKTEFCKRYPQSCFLIDGEGYEDEDLDLNIYVDGDQLALGRYAIEVSHTVQQTSGYFLLPFVFPASEYPTNR